MGDEVHVEAAGAIGIITLNRPEVRNAIDMRMLGEINEILIEIGREPTIRALVLTGANGDFSSGEDLRNASAMTESGFGDIIREFQMVTRNIRAMPQPVLAAIDGVAFGAGIEIAAACDFRFASDSATFCCPEVNIGLGMANGVSTLLARIVGEGHAREMIMTGHIVDAKRAYHMGLVNRLSRSEGLLQDTLDTAELIASRSSRAIREAKLLLNAPTELELEVALEAEREVLMRLFTTSDAREGIDSFMEKRSPQFDEQV